MRRLEARFHEASAQYLDDVDELVDRARDSVIRLRLDSLGPRDEQVAWDLLDVAEVADASPHLEDREGARMMRSIATWIGAGLKAAATTKADAHMKALQLKATPTPAEVRARAEAQRQRELVAKFNEDYVRRQAWLPARFGDLEEQRMDEARREAAARGVMLTD